MRVLVCGDRNWSDSELMHAALNGLHAETPFTLLIQGEARGADRMAACWAARKDIKVASFPARWEEFGRAAGPIRNRQMLTEGNPALVVGFHSSIKDSKGTKDMLKAARKAGCRVLLFPEGQMLP